MAEGPQGALHRVIVVALVRDDEGGYLLCRMAPDRGVFPGQWGLPGGGIEPGERMEEALRREVREEVGLAIWRIRPLAFRDGTWEKTFPDGTRRDVYMIFLLFECRAAGGRVVLNDEFVEHAWVEAGRLSEYDLNPETARTFEHLGF